MKLIFLTLFTILSLTFSSHTIAQTQTEMNEEAKNNYLKADKELNLVYNKILKAYKADAVFIKNFKNAQKIWIQFRDAEMKSKFPESQDYGSVQPMCWSSYLQELTEERTNKLKIWLTGFNEGDVCSGSVKKIK